MEDKNKKDDLTTIPFEEWNKLHYLIVFSPIAVVIIAMIIMFT